MDPELAKLLADHAASCEVCEPDRVYCEAAVDMVVEFLEQKEAEGA